MALRKRGRYYHAYFVAWERSGETLRRRQVERCLYTDDLDVARVLEQKLMDDNRGKSVRVRAEAKIDAILSGGTVTVEHAPKRRMKIADAVARAERYHELGKTSLRHWRRFQSKIRVRYMDEVSPEMALRYLDGLNVGGKTFNNIRSSLNGIFKLLLIDAGLPESPFERIHTRRAVTVSQRPFTREEYRRIVAAAPSPWREAAQIAWYTGLREKDVFTLRWAEIRGDLIRKLPAKTARFKREVLIPVHPKLAELLKTIPRDGARVLGAWSYNPDYIGFRRAFGEILTRAGVTDNREGRVCFNSFRNSFISRCDAAGIPRHAIRGIVGHVSDKMTDLYSHDEASARLIQSLPD